MVHSYKIVKKKGTSIDKINYSQIKKIIVFGT